MRPIDVMNGAHILVLRSRQPPKGAIMTDAPQKVTSLNLNPTIPYDPFVIDYMNK